ncbi:ribosome production factor 1 [Anaeramoeba flamelloides]|uniref:Ribosome production factor n=1 Tax=Anaeramoeba flamelloides TaxID=1746091 RepID=A0AAV7YSP9_9EUKA|nr:ribosome production factor [Anaeramoeba flamelloides]KAJ6246948.1 ribosome production factor 1 [Anaeramoeba flamelloides]
MVVKEEKKKQKILRRKKRQKEREELGEKAPPKLVQITQEMTRLPDLTTVVPNDPEVLFSEKTDEMSEYFDKKKKPKICFTTTGNTKVRSPDLIKDLIQCFGNSTFFARRNYKIPEIVEYCNNRKYTDIMIISECNKKINGLIHIHLPIGPTAHYKLSSVVTRSQMKHVPKKFVQYRPELIFKNFSTRLGHTVTRMLNSLMPHNPQYKGRRLLVFHNQRDFVFFRHYRYKFESKEKTSLSEIGPQFTMKLRTVQLGTWDTNHGEYIWYYRSKMGSSRLKWFL